MKKVFVVITNQNSWGKSKDLFEAIKNAGGFGNQLKRELLIKMVLTEDPESVGVDYISGGVLYSKGDQIIQLNDKPVKLIDFITEREASRIVLAGLERLHSDNKPLPVNKSTIFNIADKLEDLEYDFND